MFFIKSKNHPNLSTFFRVLSLNMLFRFFHVFHPLCFEISILDCIFLYADFSEPLKDTLNMRITKPGIKRKKKKKTKQKTKQDHIYLLTRTILLQENLNSFQI